MQMSDICFWIAGKMEYWNNGEIDLSLPD